MSSALRLMVLMAPLLAIPANAQELDDRHLPLAKITPEDRTALVASLLSLADPALPGGTATVPFTGKDDAFSQPSAGMAEDRLDAFTRGNALFRKLWIAAPSAITASDGLGPLYNARSCQACHLKDGRGHAPDGPEDDRTTMLLRLSHPGGPVPEGIAEWISTAPDPLYGGQLQDFATPDQNAEGRLEITYSVTSITLADGLVIDLRAPSYFIADPAYGPVSDSLLLSPRVAPQMIGLGLLEAIPAADILALADPDDTNGDGISGRTQIVPSVEFGVPMLGRFGHKAGAPTIREQTAAALALDMGLANPLYPDPWGDCTDLQAACRSAPHGQGRGGLEVDTERLELLTLYARNLAVPAQRGTDDPQVLKGKDIFHAIGCASCHQPTFVTQSLTDQPEQSSQLIWPYTDLLLHDMGEGLADNRPEGRASGSEWRTPPLWGVGLTETVSGHSQFLHDGRARNLLEAILWHGGEAQSQRDAIATMSAKDRAALLAFLASL